MSSRPVLGTAGFRSKPPGTGECHQFDVASATGTAQWSRRGKTRPRAASTVSLVSEQDGVREAAVTEPESGLEIVRRALAILDEEVRLWLGPPPSAPSGGDDR